VCPTICTRRRFWHTAFCRFSIAVGERTAVANSERACLSRGEKQECPYLISVFSSTIPKSVVLIAKFGTKLIWLGPGGLTACDRRSDRLGPCSRSGTPPGGLTACSRVRVEFEISVDLETRTSLRGKTSPPYKYEGPWPVKGSIHNRITNFTTFTSKP
jgi:hypothetical protein